MKDKKRKKRSSDKKKRKKRQIEENIINKNIKSIKESNHKIEINKK